jgi:NADPH:quinone reductase-like Zn-dependent oxidoreductase
VDYILCTNSVEQYITSMAEIIAPQGKICTIIGTKNNEPIPMNLFMRKSVTFVFELMFTRPTFQTADMQAQHELLSEASQLVDAGVLRTTLTERFGPLNAANLRRAHARVELGTMIGKLALGGIE